MCVAGKTRHDAGAHHINQHALSLRERACSCARAQALRLAVSVRKRDVAAPNTCPEFE
jgi:hypothetical protein